MQIICRKVLREFWEQFTDSEVALCSWYRIMTNTDFSGLEALRQTFPSVDNEGDLFGFNIGRNRYILIASIYFNWNKVFIREIRIHPGYFDRVWKK